MQEAIKYVVLHKGDATQLPVIKYLTAQHKSPGSTISRNISNAIAYAWKISAPEELAKIYTSRIKLITSSYKGLHCFATNTSVSG